MKRLKARLFPLLITFLCSQAAIAAKPEIYTIQNGTLSPSKGDTPIDLAIASYQRDYGILINDRILAGYLFDEDANNQNPNYPGYNISAHIQNPIFSKWFHDPFPHEPERENYVEAEREFLKTGVMPVNVFENIDQAIAYEEIDFVYMPENYFSQGYYYNPIDPSKSTKIAFESVLHEALHVWHGRHPQEVDELLHSKGSYYDKVKISESVCPFFKDVTEQYDQKSYCGFKTKDEAILTVLKKARWPQRCGSLTQRECAYIRGNTGCEATSSHLRNFNGQILCVDDDADGKIGDVHSMDNEHEYFAILMQRYILDPVDFKKTATTTEALFAQIFFSAYFH